MTFYSKLGGIALAMALAVPAVSQAAVFDLTDIYGSPTDLTVSGNTATASVDGIDLTVTGSDDLVVTNLGLGIDTTSDAYDHATGVDGNEVLTFDFSPALVSAVALVFEEGTDTDSFFFEVSDGTDTFVSDLITFGGSDGNTVVEFNLADYFTAGQLTQITSFSIIAGTTAWSNVKVQDLTVYVPIPPAALLLLSGIGGLAFAARRRKA